MKKLDIFNTIQSGLAVIILTLLSLLPCVRVSAQGVQSAQYQILSQMGDNVVVRESTAGRPVISYRSSLGARFAYGYIDVNDVRQFAIGDTATYARNTISYKINDMRVVGNMCYFCGVRRYIYADPDPETGETVVDSVGIVGRFRLSPLGFYQSHKYHLKHVHETKSLDRMVAYAHDGDTVIAMIGIVDNPASESCVTVARVTTTDPWKYYVKYTDNSVVEEVFTDIAVDSRNVMIASYHRNVAGKGYFNLRVADKGSVKNITSTDFDIRYKYAQSPSALSGLCYSLDRPDYAAVHLCAASGDSKVYAAYACCVDNIVPVYPTALCAIETNSKNLLNTQIVQKTYLTPHTLVDMEYIGGSTGTGIPASVALLHRTGGLYQTVVEYPYANIGSYVVMRALVQKMTDNVLGSVSVYGGADIRFGGVWSPALNRLTYLQELLPSLADEDLCMPNHDAGIVTMDGPVVPESDPSPLMQKTPDMESLNWGHKTAVSSKVNVETKCKYDKD